MKLTLISTTIYLPKVFELYRSFGKDVEIIVAGDKKTPHDEVKKLFARLGNARYLDVEAQQALGYKCSDIIGWNSVQRRNIALLEAMKGKPDIIITVDDDNLPLSPDYFDHFRRILGAPFSGVIADAKPDPNIKQKWFDVGRMLTPQAIHRGFPNKLRHADLGVTITPVTNVKVGVAAGLWLGDPDTDALNRIVNRPVVSNMSEVLKAGLLVTPGCFTPFNSQNTGYKAELAPLMMVLPQVGRYDDIWAAYVAERVMMARGEHVHFGQPLVWQERNAHNLLTDLKQEMLGLEYTERFVQDLLDTDIGKGDVVSQLRKLYEKLKNCDYIPQATKDTGFAWCDDVEKVLA